MDHTLGEAEEEAAPEFIVRVFDAHRMTLEVCHCPIRMPHMPNPIQSHMGLEHLMFPHAADLKAEEELAIDILHACLVGENDSGGSTGGS